jgi:hypothetical protein
MASHWEWLAMPEIHCSYFQTSQLFDAGFEVCQVVDVKTTRFAEKVAEQVTAKQSRPCDRSVYREVAGCQNADGPLGMSGQMKNLGIESIFREIKALFNLGRRG